MDRINREVLDILPVEYKKTFIIGKKWGLLEKATFICSDISVSEYFKFQSFDKEEKEQFIFDILDKWHVKSFFGSSFFSLFSILSRKQREEIIKMFFVVFPKADPSLKSVEAETDDIQSISRSFTIFCEKFSYTPEYVLNMPARTYIRMLSDISYISRESSEEGKKENKIIDNFDRKIDDDVLDVLEKMRNG